jgi:hypothetical protein
MVNTSFAIFDKSGGMLAGPTDINQLWNGQGGLCEANNDGDPVVLYDPLADRWLLSQFAVAGGPPYAQCIAVSQTSDPEGAYWLYEFSITDAFPDYPKLAVWPDAYYMTTNDDGEPNVGVFAFDRSRMLAGNPATFQKFQVQVNFLLPGDFDGSTPPPVGSPSYFYTMMDDTYWPARGFPGVDRLEIWEFRVNFTTPTNSTFGHVLNLPTAAFNYDPCGNAPGSFNCIPQQGTSQKIDAIGEWPMWRLAYRNFGAYETLVGNFTVNIGDFTNHAGIRWFELRKSGAGSWSIFQEGTHSPDNQHRFMGSIAMDRSGDIALGYSVSSSSLFPSIRYATRLLTDTLGTLQSEATLIAGGGSQTGFNRWGDYSAMSIDPADDCTFWYTNEYYASTSAINWQTRIGAFKLPTCGLTSPTINTYLPIIVKN